MKNFWKYAALLMTAAAGGMLTSCQDKTEPEEDPVTIKKVWAAKTEYDVLGECYSLLDFGMIDGKYHLCEAYQESEEFRERMKTLYGVELSEHEIPYYSFLSSSGEALSCEVTETDATSGTVTISDGERTYFQLSYKNLTKNSVTIIFEEDGETAEEKECRTPEGWGLTVAGYVDITSYVFPEDEQ